MPVLDVRAGFIDVDRMLGDEDHVGAAGDPAHHRDPPGLPTHHLDDHHPVVRLGGRVQPVDCFGADGDRGIEAERVVGRGEVVVDRLRDPDHGEAVLTMQPRGNPQRVFAADRHE